MPSETEAQALAAIDAVIDDFGNNRVEAYFARFAEDATFVFHTSPRRLESRAEYEALWAEWQRDDAFEVVSCTSSDRRVQVLSNVAVFSHSVETVARISGALETQHERESIIMELRDGVWLCVHEHLSGKD